MNCRVLNHDFPVSPLMSPDLSHRYDCSLSTNFSSNPLGNCPCILFPRHLPFIFSAVLSSTCLAPLTNSVLSRLAVCNTAELMLCWFVPTVCHSGSSFLSTYSTSFEIFTAWAASNCIRPLPPCFLGTYKRSTSAFW